MFSFLRETNYTTCSTRIDTRKYLKHDLFVDLYDELKKSLKKLY